MIVLFTDFGLEGPYTGQIKIALHAKAPAVPVIDLFSDVPACQTAAAAYLLAAYSAGLPQGTVVLAVVDPGVGGARRALVVEVDGRHFVGPDNGLFELVIRRSGAQARCWNIIWRPDALSASFHGRDLFAPVAAELFLGTQILSDTSRFAPLDPAVVRRQHWPDDLHEIIYFDHFGNALTGIRFSQLSEQTRLRAGDREIVQARTFSSVSPGEMFYYENANGLVEIAINQGRAKDFLNLTVGGKIELING
jgi:S-adenosyl-L-methionine hydrolase (adenosine-forming)